VRAEQAFQTHRLHVRVHAREGGNIAPVRRQAQACTREHEGGNNRVQKRDAQSVFVCGAAVTILFQLADHGALRDEVCRVCRNSLQYSIKILEKKLQPIDFKSIFLLAW
jgi:precorrin isomerase